MSLRDEIFPKDLRPEFTHTRYAEGWEGIFWGFGYAAKFLTQHRANFGATIDQAGLAIVFLQRHRLELGLKTLLSVVRPDALNNTHGLLGLWKGAEDAMCYLDRRTWDQLLAPHRDLVELLDRVDPRSLSFRYPTDREGTPVDRPPYVDLDALERRVDDFHWGVEGVLLWFRESRDP